ncbi:hypothetical protein DCAR_0417800 [Daucus carota subsp. sativus]|uniref:Uncharacterized protein n=1 Tax=Daucus carota subsp. sativus TaxID=79200 RepID=A0AAF0WZ15_DAUCS|nr:PREDICTED: uncharacterized protein LOC108219025 [Daucus carota subsp. sativus]WOG98457.1 hypothetical protein DCAR_0417800 [Daucus carota subsp. sativus]
MSVERSLEAWEEVQRHSHDLADRFAQGFTGLLDPDRFAKGFNGLIHSHISPPSFSWPNPVEFSEHNLIRDFKIPNSYIDGVGSKLGKAGNDFGASISGVVQQVFRGLPLPFKKKDSNVGALNVEKSVETAPGLKKGGEDIGSLAKRFRDFGFVEMGDGGLDGSVQKGGSRFDLDDSGDKRQRTLNFTSTYDSRRRYVKSSLSAGSEWWRVEASNGNDALGSEDSSSLLVQLGPILYIRDASLLLPVHFSNQHLIWYGYDRKTGMHTICPALWSKNRSWSLMSLICLNPVACPFMDLQHPNGQLTYTSGEGLYTSAFLPFRGGVLQAQGRYPGEMKFSYSRKDKWGTRITPTVQWPDRSFTLGLNQALSWKRSGLMVRPSVQVSLNPTFGGSNPGLRAEVVHSAREELSLICGCALTTRPSAYASVSLGRSKWNGNVGSSGIVVRAETPLGSVGRPSFSIQLNSALEF